MGFCATGNPDDEGLVANQVEQGEKSGVPRRAQQDLQAVADMN